MTSPTPQDMQKHFAKFVSSVEGHLVARHGSRPMENIGASRKHPDPNKPARMYDFDAPRVELVWDTKTVFALTHREYALYKREYDRAIQTKALTERTAEDYIAWLEEEEAAGKELLAKQKADAAKQTADAKTTTEGADQA